MKYLIILAFFTGSYSAFSMKTCEVTCTDSEYNKTTCSASGPTVLCQCIKGVADCNSPGLHVIKAIKEAPRQLSGQDRR